MYPVRTRAHESRAPQALDEHSGNRLDEVLSHAAETCPQVMIIRIDDRRAACPVGTYVDRIVAKPESLTLRVVPLGREARIADQFVLQPCGPAEQWSIDRHVVRAASSYVPSYARDA